MASELTVVIDERVRLVTAVLAASHWPEMEQAQTTHAVHPHSKQVKQWVRPFQNHRAVQRVNDSFGANVGLDSLFTAVLRCGWSDKINITAPPEGAQDWIKSLADFAVQSQMLDFWADHAQPWEEARTGLDVIFSRSQIISFLGQLLGQTVAKNVAVMPTVTYPMLNPVLAETDDTVFFILPPAKAWGESPPWPHGEDPGWVIAQTCWHLANHFLADTLGELDEINQALLLHAAVTLCLEADFDEAEAMAYLVRSKKEHNLPRLPLVVEQLRDYLAGNGRSLTEILL
jgi:hypothetical protein